MNIQPTIHIEHDSPGSQWPQWGLNDIKEKVYALLGEEMWSTIKSEALKNKQHYQRIWQTFQSLKKPCSLNNYSHLYLHALKLSSKELMEWFDTARKQHPQIGHSYTLLAKNLPSMSEIIKDRLVWDLYDALVESYPYDSIIQSKSKQDFVKRSWTTETPEQKKEFLAKLHDLKELAFDWEYFSGLALRNYQYSQEEKENIKIFFQSCNEIKSINIRQRLTYFQDEILSYIFTPLTYLRSLMLENNDICSQTPARLRTIFQHAYELRRLLLSGNSFTTLQNEHAQAIFQHLTNLRYLDISHTNLPNDPQVLASMFGPLTNLRYLDLHQTKIPIWEKNIFLNIFWWLKNLEHLDLEEHLIPFISVGNLEVIATHCQSIRSLNLTSTKLFSTPLKSVRTLFSGVQDLTNLSVKNNTLDEKKISVFKEILTHIPWLRDLNIIGTEISSLSFTSILYLFEGFQNLEQFHWNDFNFSKLTETEIVSIFSQLKNLKSLNLAENNTIDFPLNTWKKILLKMSKLESIDISKSSISEDSLAYLKSNFSGIILFR